MATPKNVILKYKTSDIGLNKVLEAYRDKINNIIKNVPWVTASVDYVRFKDTNETHYLEMFWGEDDLADRTLELNVNSGSRVINLSGNLIVESASTLNQDLTTDASWTSAGLSSTGEIDVTKATALLVDLNPGFTGTGNVIELTPSAAIATEDAAYCGFFIDGTSLTPTSAGVEIDGIFIDFSAITLAQTPVVHGLHIKMPGQETALHTDGEIHVDYATGSSAGAEYTAVDIILDVSSLDTNSEIHGLDVALAGSTSGSVAALGSHPGIDVIHQHVGTFGNIDTGYTLVGSTYTAEAFTSATAIVAANGDSILIGEDAVFDEIQVAMTVVATKTAFPKFYYSYDNAGTAAWTQFFPADDTEGFVYSGTIRMNSADLVAGGWEASDPDDGGGVTATKFYVKITRNRTASIGSPTATLKTLASTEYMWDKTGAITALSFSTGTLTLADGSITDSNGAITFVNENLDTSGYIALKSNAELRFYDNGNYVGFEAPALGADQVWVLPTADGANLEHIVTDGAGNLSWTTGAGTGNVIAAGNFGTDNVILRSDGVAKGCQHTGITIDNSENVSGMGTLGCNVLTVDASGIAWDATTGLATFQDSADRQIVIGGLGIFRRDSNANADLRINYLGYNGGATQFRDFDIYDGKTNLIARFNGSTGNVGINDPTPTYKLDVNGTGRFTGAVTLDSTLGCGRLTITTSSYQLYFVDTGDPGNDWRIGTAVNVDLAFYRNATELMKLTAGGNLSLSSATSQITGGTQLSIEAGSGGIKSQTIYNDTSVLSADIIIIPSGSNQYALYRSTSAQKYKDKIKDLELDSSLIYNLRPRSFNSLGKADDKNKRFIGLIADEVEQVYPDVVRYNENNEVENYDNQMLMTLMLAEIQVLRKEIDKLKIKKGE